MNLKKFTAVEWSYSIKCFIGYRENIRVNYFGDGSQRRLHKTGDMCSNILIFFRNSSSHFSRCLCVRVF